MIPLSLMQEKKNYKKIIKKKKNLVFFRFDDLSRLIAFALSRREGEGDGGRFGNEVAMDVPARYRVRSCGDKKDLFPLPDEMQIQQDVGEGRITVKDAGIITKSPCHAQLDAGSEEQVTGKEVTKFVTPTGQTLGR